VGLEVHTHDGAAGRRLRVGVRAGVPGEDVGRRPVHRVSVIGVPVIGVPVWRVMHGVG
jgi:hypothetical protein